MLGGSLFEGVLNQRRCKFEGGRLFEGGGGGKSMEAKSLPMRLYSLNVLHAIMTETRSPVSN